MSVPLNRQLMVHGPGGSRSAGWKVTCSRSSLKTHAAGHGGAVGRQDLDVADGQLGRIEHDLFGRLVDDGVDPTVPEKVAEATSGSISMW